MEFLRDRNYTNLFWAEPSREHTCIFLNQPCQCSLIASHGCTVDDVWTLFLTIFIDVVHIKLFSKKSIPLDRDHCIFFSVYIFGIDINLRSVECSFSNILCKWNVQFFKHLADMSFCLIPHFCITDVFLSVVRIPFGKVIGYVLLYTKNLQTVLCKCDTVFKFFYHLVRSYDQMTFGDRELTHTCQTMHFPGILITEQSGCFTVTKRQITIAVLFCFVYIVLEWACHRTKRKYFFVCFFVAENEHALFVMIPVSGNLVEVALCH